MKLPRRQFLHLAAGVAALLAASQPADAQGYPSRPITMIVPFPAGGGTDVIARIVSEHMSRTLGQPIVIENVAGAGGTTGTARAMRADGGARGRRPKLRFQNISGLPQGPAGRFRCILSLR